MRPTVGNLAVANAEKESFREVHSEKKYKVCGLLDYCCSAYLASPVQWTAWNQHRCDNRPMGEQGGSQLSVLDGVRCETERRHHQTAERPWPQRCSHGTTQAVWHGRGSAPHGNRIGPGH